MLRDRQKRAYEAETDVYENSDLSEDSDFNVVIPPVAAMDEDDISDVSFAVEACSVFDLSTWADDDDSYEEETEVPEGSDVNKDSDLDEVVRPMAALAAAYEKTQVP